MVGKSLSHYRIESELGRGGMGIVYRALDTKLDRTVAIKVLPSAALSSEDDRARFYREAKAAAQIHHPNIASVFEIDEAVPEGSKDDDLRPFIAMEFIEGVTLHDRISKGPLQLADSVRIASEIASALEAAHEKGIVHRDIKAANVMLTAKGSAKVLDFGLAQTSASTKLTRMGSTLGTVAYMSPEQARGEEVDSRTDLWSLGAVLYEMITGRSPFPGDYEQAVVYEILNQDPEPLTAVRTGVPMQLEWLVNKLLSKNASERYQSATGVLVDLKSVGSSLSEMNNPSVSGGTSIRRASPNSTIIDTSGEKKWTFTLTHVVGIIGLVMMLTFAVATMLLSTPDVDTSVGGKYLLSNVLSDGTTVSVLEDHFAVSNDNKWIVFVGRSDGLDRLYKLRTGEINPVEITDTENAQFPFFSDDGRYIGFFADQSLKKVLLDGGRPEIITTQTGSNVGGNAPRGAAWTREGLIYFPLQRGIAQVAATGGTPEMVVPPDSSSPVGYFWPKTVHDEEYILITVFDRSSQSYRIATADIISGRVSIVLDEEGLGGQVTRSGQLLFNRLGQLMSAGFDRGAGQLTTIPSVVPRNHILPDRSAGFGISDNGKLVTVARLEDPMNSGQWQWLWVDRNGEEVPVSQGETTNSGIYHRISPNGANIAFNGESGLEIYSIDQNQNYPFESAARIQSAWSPRGDFLAFTSRGGLYIKRTDFTEPRRLVFETNHQIYVTSWSPDAQTIAYHDVTNQQGRDIWMYNISDSVATEYVVTPHNERAAYFSGDGKWVAYVTDKSGRDEIWVDSFPVRGAETRVSTNGGSEPVWSRDNQFLYYREGTRMIAASIALEPTFRVITTVELFDGPSYLRRDNGSAFDVHPDSTRFLMIRDPSQLQVNSLVVEENWLPHYESSLLN